MYFYAGVCPVHPVQTTAISLGAVTLVEFGIPVIISQFLITSSIAEEINNLIVEWGDLRDAMNWETRLEQLFLFALNYISPRSVVSALIVISAT